MENKIIKNTRSIFDKINNEVLDLHLKWLNFKEVYVESQEQIDFLNKIAPTFFAIVQIVYCRDILLDISKLTDPVKTGNSNENLTLYTLLKAIDTEEYKELYNEASLKLKSLKNECKDIRNIRNKVIAHNDFNRKINKENFKLTEVNVKIIESVLKVIREFMNLFNVYFDGDDIEYENIIFEGSGKDLVRKLKDS